MAGRGTGVPIWFRCSSCRGNPHALPEWGAKVVRTGRTKPLTGKARTNGNQRTLRELHEYKCCHCSHLGWSRHKGVLNHPVEIPPT